MSQATVVYESLMGNTRRIAEAVADGIGDGCPDARVSCYLASDVPPLGAAQADLLVVGAPTHFFSLPRRRSRSLWLKRYRPEARADGSHPTPAPGAGGPGVLEWLASLPEHPSAPPGLCATFDTRLDRATAGSAARRIARELRRLGYELAAEPTGVIVEDMAGPLRAGEYGRAREWGADLGRRLQASTAQGAAT